uniref:Uncharacterized protein n=1 Tax=Leersia perrieri TaxID=77586 RepID=A0A0D9XWE0_9ORYZ
MHGDGNAMRGASPTGLLHHLRAVVQAKAVRDGFRHILNPRYLNPSRTACALAWMCQHIHMRSMPTASVWPSIKAQNAFFLNR